MEDLRTKLDKLIADAAECDLIANLAAEKDKREAFRSLAVQYRKMADAIRTVIADRTK
jgi:hypothetical protein